MRLAILFVSLGLACSAPVPLQAQVGKHIDTEDGLIVLVPTVSANDNRIPGQPTKREVEYELITIPGKLLRRKIRQISGLYNTPAATPIGGSAALGQPGYIAPVPAQAFGVPAPAFGGDAVLSTAGNILETTGNNINAIGDATVQNAGNAIQFISEVSQGAGATIAESAGSGIQYAGQLSGALLRALLQVPAIKIKVLGRIIEETQPLTKAINDVVGDSSGDLSRSFEATTSILSDALGLIIRLIQDSLALKGRIIAQIGSSGLDFAPKIIDGAIKIGGAAIQSGSGVARAIGDGVGDLVQIGANARFPAKPAFSKISLPSVPSPVIPNIDLSAIFSSATPAHEAPPPAPLPVALPAPAPAPVALPAPAPAPVALPAPAPTSFGVALPAPAPAPAPVPLAPVSSPALTPNSLYGPPAQGTILTPAQPEQFYTIVN